MIGISGSLRRGSYNTALLRHAAGVAPDGMRVEIADISSFPLYNADLRSEIGFPEPVAALRGALRDADGLLIASPEYNHSFTGALKNAIDWLSTGADSPLPRKPTAIMGAGGRLGTVNSQAALRAVLVHNDVAVINRPEVLVMQAWEQFDDNLDLVDARTAGQVRRLMVALAGQIRLHRRRDHAVVCGGDDATLTAVARLAAEAGYEVATTTDPTWAAARLESHPPALLVVTGGATAASGLSAVAAAAGVRAVVVDSAAEFLDVFGIGTDVAG